MKNLMLCLPAAWFLLMGCVPTYYVVGNSPDMPLERAAENLAGEEAKVFTVDAVERDLTVLGIASDTLVCRSEQFPIPVRVPVASLWKIETSSVGAGIFGGVIGGVFGALGGGLIGLTTIFSPAAGIGMIVGPVAGAASGAVIGANMGSDAGKQVYQFADLGYHQTPSSAEWYEMYQAGTEAFEEQHWQAVVTLMSAAIAGKSEEHANERVSGLRFIDYFPYLYRGLAHLHLGNSDQALVDLERSERAGEVARASIDRDAVRLLDEGLAAVRN